MLLVEDSDADEELVVRALKRGGFRVTHERVMTGDALRAALTAKPWDIILSDWYLPTFDAMAALGIVKSIAPDMPFVVVTGTMGEECAVAAMRAGARDYLVKDRLERLPVVVRRELQEGEVRRAARAAEAALHASEARFRRLWDAGIFFVAIADGDGRIAEINDAGAQMLGYEARELVATEWDRLTPAEWSGVSAAARRQLAERGAVTPYEKALLRRDGSQVPVLVSGALLGNGERLIVAVDLTEQKRSERAKNALEEQLRQVQKMEAVGRLAGGIAHDFNNMLSVILSYAELIVTELRSDDPLRADVEEMRTAATRAAGLTRQLLLMSRQEVMEPKTVELHEIVTGMRSMLERILGEDIELVVVAPPAKGLVHVDPTQIEQVILNLVVNARDAMPTGGTLTLETRSVDLDEAFAGSHLPVQPGPYVLLAVTDTGIGMDKELQRHIFEPFFTTKPPGKGTGLGLSTVFGIVKQSGGSIWVYSEPGRGATFKVYLPRVVGKVDAVDVPSAPATLRGSETILLVEDEDQVRAIVASILRRQGYDVMTANNAGEALLLCESHTGRIDLLVTDVVMPHMSGPQLAKRLRELRPEIKVLCMSGYTDDSVVRHGLIDSTFPFVQKPVTPGALAKKVREVLDGR